MRIKSIKLRNILKVTFIILIFTLVVSYFLYVKATRIPPLYIPMPANEIPNVDYKVTAKLDNLPTEAMVFKFKKPKDPKAEIKSLAKIFGLKGEVQYRTYGNAHHFVREYYIKEGEDDRDHRILSYEIDSGCWQYVDMKEYINSDNSDPEKLPSDEEAKKIALDFLKKSGIYDKRFVYCGVSKDTAGSPLTNDYRVLRKDVCFYPVVDGKDVYGVSRITILMGENGKIIRVSKRYKEYEEYKKVKIIPVEKALEKVRKKEASTSINPQAKSATIKEAFLAYWEDAGTIDEQPYLQPVWVFIGDAVTEDGKVESFDAIVPAIE